jgi:hypothetical protein
MERKVIVKIPAQKARETEKTIFICDLCRKEHSDTFGMARCKGCGRLVCDGTFERCCKSDPDDYGDNPDEYCNICYNLKYNVYAKDYDKIQKVYDEKKEKLDAKIKAESLRYEQAD